MESLGISPTNASANTFLEQTALKTCQMGPTVPISMEGQSPLPSNSQQPLNMCSPHQNTNS